jgi:hypothetical protein
MFMDVLFYSILFYLSEWCSFLQAKGLFGSGIDCRVTAFFNPAHKSNTISKKVVNELDKAAVEIVSHTRTLCLSLSVCLSLSLFSLSLFLFLLSEEQYTSLSKMNVYDLFSVRIITGLGFCEERRCGQKTGQSHFSRIAGKLAN